MISRIIIAIAGALLLSSGAAAQDPTTDFIKRAQQRLTELGFYNGPINGDFGQNTQAALVRFQLANILPASGQLDVETSLELGVARDATAAAGESAGRGDSRATPENTSAGGG